jgi:hypothetical protein
MSWSTIISPNTNRQLNNASVTAGSNVFQITGPDDAQVNIFSISKETLNLNLLQTDTEWTIEAWLKYTPSSTFGLNGVVFTNGGEKNNTYSIYSLLLNGDNKLIFVTGRDEGGGTSGGISILSNVIPTNEWFHIAIVYTKSKLIVYQNGIAVNELVGALSVGPITDDFYVGYIRGPYTDRDRWNGCISNLRITRSIVYAANFTPLRELKPATDILFKLDSEFWVFLTRPFATAGTLYMDYTWTNTDRDLNYDWAIWDVTDGQPNVPGRILGDTKALRTSSSTLPISYTANKWISLGIYSSDHILGAGNLGVTFRYTPTIGTALATGTSSADVEFTTLEPTTITYTAIATDGSTIICEPLNGKISITGLTPNTSYTFKIKATYANGDVLSETSNSITTFSVPSITDGYATSISTAEILFTDVGITPVPTYTPVIESSNASLTYDISGNKITISGLTANTTYNFQIRATYATGSALSTSIQIKTFSQPSIGIALVTGSSTAIVTFTAPMDETGILNYTAISTPPGGSSNVVTGVETLYITELEPNRDYTFEIKATYPTGTSLSPSSNQIKTFSLPPTGIATTTGSSTAKVSFTATDVTGIASFTVQDATMALESTTLTNTFAGTLYLSNLSPHTTYRFRIWVTYENATTASSAELNPITTFSVPSIQIAYATSISTAEITFTDDNRIGSLPTYSPVNVAANGEFLPLSFAIGAGLTISLTNLTIGTTYNFKIKATYLTGESFSETGQIKTFSQPTIGTAIATGKATAEVTFTAPTDKTGILNYTAISLPSGGNANVINPVMDNAPRTLYISGLESDKTYSFKVCATYEHGTAASAESNLIKTLKDNSALVVFIGQTLVVNLLFSVLNG